MKYYIFGGNGFVGCYLANALCERNYNVVVCDVQTQLSEEIDARCEYLQVDIRKREQINEIKFLP